MKKTTWKEIRKMENPTRITCDSCGKVSDYLNTLKGRKCIQAYPKWDIDKETDVITCPDCRNRSKTLKG